ncbi:hypothetical protein [Pseudonocardia sp. HH130630-07]|uniref:hypothetical protein n=1 Tax=Pseudonocardia sp. HH130630-07 TaxID=1690815 RepID=UPI000814D324|nr:hypothetical protein [Pseudonocardia sp. HH130630-07]ANY05817.1 hypothetical protein AFB00_05345 [Pseudonocardia sp. HH130630-07]
MNTVARLSVFAAGVLLLGAGAFAVGTVVDAGPAPAVANAGGPAPGPAPATADARSAGLSSTASGYTLLPLTPRLPADRPAGLAFRVTGPDGRTVTGFDVAREKRMHLVVVRRDTAGYQHLSPVMEPDGTWRAPTTPAGGGSYRVIADFVPTGGPPTVLGADVSVAGGFSPVAPLPSRVGTAPGGYEVRLDGDLVPGRYAEVALTVARDGRPVTDLQPHLGAYGDLVALRDGDLGYLRAHAQGGPGDGVTPAGPRMIFHAEVPTAGAYRLFLDFRHAGAVHTVQFTVPVSGPAGTQPGGPAPDAGHVEDEGTHR